MTKTLRETLNLPDLGTVMRDAQAADKAGDTEDEEGFGAPLEADPKLAGIVEQARVASERLAMVDGKDHAEAMDSVFRQSMQHAKDLVDLGFNVDHPRAARFFEVAAQMYEKAISAKSSKRDSQLKAVKLALDQRKLDLEERKLDLLAGQQHAAVEPPPDAGRIMADRNELIRRLREEKAGKPPGES